jgi:hypothetical protein
MSGGAVSGNTSSSDGGGVFVLGSDATFSMSGGVVSGNTASSGGGGVYVLGSDVTFSMSGGVVSGNTASSGGGGVYVFATFNMSGGAVVRDNILAGTNGYGKEVLSSGTFTLSGGAMPQRVFLYNNSRSVTISGPLSGGVVPIDLGVTSSAPLTGYVDQPILTLDSTYSTGNLAELKDHFSLGDAKRTDSSTAGTAITGYKIDDGGYFVTAP